MTGLKSRSARPNQLYEIQGEKPQVSLAIATMSSEGKSFRIVHRKID